jgi:two-component system, NarL family, nitrate/nitrite response regulator NarL
MGYRAGTSVEDGTRFVIVDDHGLLGQSLTFALGADGWEVEQCTDLTAEGILSSVRPEDVEVVLLDLHVGGDLGSTLPLIPEIIETGTKVVMMTGVTDRVRLAECVEAGVIGIIAKSQPFDDLVKAVRHAVAEGNLISPGEREGLLSELRRSRAEQRRRSEVFEQLTRREAQVLAGLMDGRSAEQIASEWVVSITTVRSQIRSLLMKLDVNSQLSAVALARKAGWEPEPD